MAKLCACTFTLFLVVLGGQGLLAETAAAGPCDPPSNEIVCENSKQGNPPSEWDVEGSGDPAIQGFATQISVNRGETIHFKIDTTYDQYHIEIYRMGYYGGDGARRVDTIPSSATVAQNQPFCGEEATTGLIDCGNWSVSASWSVPATAVSGIYFAKLVPEEEPSSDGSHIVFVVRNDEGESELLFQTSDTTWEAYNSYGGKSLYTGGPGTNPGRAYKVSYNRPLTTRGTTAEDSPFNAEYPMVRWLERNGYDVSYTTGVDADRRGSEMLEHKVYMSVGHDEYWSGQQRANVEAARDAGVNVAFFSGNEIFWKTRWEEGIGGSSSNPRTLVCYKETHANEPIDPEDPSTWTGTWMDPRFTPPADGGRPQNELSGTLFAVNAGTAAIEVPAADAQLRLWRNTGVASLEPGESVTLGEDTLGYEWDEEPDNGFRPAGLVDLSSTTVNVSQRLLDYGSTYGPGTVTHHLTLYRAPSGALVFGAGTVQWSWGLDGHHDRGETTADSNMQQATANLFADMGVQPGTMQEGLVAATQTTDSTPPTSSIATPVEGAEVETGKQITVSGSASDHEGEGVGGGQVGGVEVSVDGGATWHPASGRESWTYSWTPDEEGQVTVMSRAVDDSGNLEEPGDQVTVDAVAQSCPCSIWDESFSASEDSDPNAGELGVKFRSDASGYITGIRFYKTSGNVGTHVGHLWTASGTQLAEATFTGESASGWQQATFDSPVAVTADTTYIASYFAPSGHYASIGAYFSLVGVDTPPLHALASGVDGPNGVYKYGSNGGLFSGGEPDSFDSENYLVDVVFQESVAPDTTSPTVNGHSPVDGATEVGTGVTVGASFSEAMDASTISDSTVELLDPAEEPVPAAVTYSSGQRKVTLDPVSALRLGKTYTVRIKGGEGGVADLAGNPLAVDDTWTFTTEEAPPPPPDEGTGGPILVISHSENPFSRYYSEILRAEGLNEFITTDVSNVTPAVLEAHDVAILAEGELSASQATMLSEWVQQGGNLIAMRPDSRLSGLLGLSETEGSLGNAYLKVDNATSPGAGIVGQTIQFHGTADRYTAESAQTVATLYSNASTAISSPAVTLRSVGPNGGHAAAFTYDLAKSVIYTRQGNPAWAGEERDGNLPIRSDDLFYGNKAGDEQPDWVNLSKVEIPQADEQQRLLTNLIEDMNLERKPLPRFWFLPRGDKAAIVMTGDDHGNGGTAGRFHQYEEGSEPGCVVAEWQCIRSTSYIYPNTPLTDAEASAFSSAGFEIALHTVTNCADWSSRAALESLYAEQLEAFAENFPSLPAPASNRTHCIVWSDWASQPKVELKNGVRLDTTYYYWPGSWVQDRPGMFTGSGMPMRFSDSDGSMIDVYQAATQMTDESEQTYPFTVKALLENALGPKGYYGVFTANMHTDYPESEDSDAIVAEAQAQGVPIVSARQMLTWLDGRNQSSFGSVEWSGGTLSFTISRASGANGLRAMLPVSSAIGPLQTIYREGTPVATTTETIKGVEYAFFDAAPGSYGANYLDEAAPVISSVQAAVGNDGTATITWSTNEPADSRVEYGTDPEALTSSKSDSAFVTSHSVQLTELEPDMTYNFRVSSADAESNSTTEPNPLLTPQTFATPPPAPVLSATVPPSPANQNAPLVVGSAAAGTIVRIYAGADCSSSPVVTAIAAELETGVAVAVPDNSSTEFRATASSGAGASECSAPIVYVEDSIAPDTQLTAQPGALLATSTAHFEFTGEDPGGSGVKGFQCRLDSSEEAAWSSCASPQDLTGLAEGAHKFEVRAIDEAGNADQSPAVAEWTVDTQAPDTMIATGPEALSSSAKATFTFSGDDGSGSGVAGFQCRLDSTEAADWKACDSGSAEYEELSQGSHRFEVRAIDEAGNADQSPAVSEWSVDTIAPTVQVDSRSQTLLKAGETSEVTWHADENGSFQLRVGGGDCESGTTVDSGPYTTQPASRTSTVGAADLAEGANTLRLCLTDAATNTGQVTTSLTKDTQAPDTMIATGPEALSSSAKATFTFSGDDGSGSGVAGFQCRLDSTEAADWKACDSGSAEYEELSQGSHRFEVRAIDEAGNADQSPAVSEWSVDTIAPTVQVDSRSQTLLKAGETSEVTWHADENGSFQLRVGGGDCESGTTVDSGPYTTQPASRTSTVGAADLAEGANTLRLCLTDAATNTGQVTTSLTKDTQAPDTTIATGPEALSNSAKATFTFSGDDGSGSGVAGFQCRLDSEDSGDWKACDSGSAEYEELSQGSHKFEARAIDEAGNADQSPAVSEWSVDTIAPDTLITKHPEAFSSSTTAEFQFTGEDLGGSGVAGFECRQDSTEPNAWQPCTSPIKYFSLAEGSHKFEVRVIDKAGNPDSVPANFAWTIDSKAPDTQLTAQPGALLATSTAHFEFTGEDPGGSGVKGFQCRLDSSEEAAWSSCASPQDLTGLAEGAHKFEVRAIDEAGNADQSPAVAEWTVDTQAPDTTIATGPEALSSSAKATFTFSGDDGSGSGVAGFQCRLDSSEAADWKACDSGSAEYEELSQGSHRFEARAIDEAGNADQSPAVSEWSVDTIAPTVQVDSRSQTLLKAGETSEVTWHADENGSFQLRVGGGDCESGTTVDSGPYTTQPASRTSTVGAADLAEGANTLRLCLTDAATNTGQVTTSLTVDTQAPDTTIATGPEALSSSAKATFTFSGDDGSGSGVAGFQCRLDSTEAADWKACDSGSAEYEELSQGSHKFEARAIDEAGNADQSPAVSEWSVDTIAPTVQVDSRSQTLLKAGETSEVTWHADENGSFQLRVGGGDCESGTTVDSGPYTTQPASRTSTVGAADLAEGANTLRLCLTDAATNTGQVTTSLTKDTQAPDTTIATGPEALSNSAKATFTFSGDDGSGSGVAGFQCRLDSEDSGDWKACDSGSAEYEELSQGAHRFEVRAIDEAGNADQSPAVSEWSVDTIAPTVQVDSGPTGLTNDSTPTFTFSSEPGAAFECSIDTGTADFKPCSDSASDTSESPLADGSWIFRVRAADEAGNQATATQGFEVDATPPDTHLTLHPASLVKVSSAHFEFTGEDPGGSGVAGFECRQDSTEAADWKACDSGSAEYEELSQGSHRFEVRAIDEAGNADSVSDSFTWIVDTVAPTTTIDSGPPALASTSTAHFEFTGEDPGGSGVKGFQCRLDSSEEAAWSSCASPQDLTGLAEGAHKFEVRAIDEAGNADQSPAVAEWTKDTQAPDTTIATGPEALSSSAKATFTFSGDDGSGSGVAGFQCRLDSSEAADWKACDSGSAEYEELSQGPHKFEARAIDEAGNADQSPAISEWSVDTIAPTVQVDSGPPAFSSSAGASFAFSGSDPGGSGVASFECRRDSESWGACTSPRSYAALAEGPHTFEVRAIDSAGNVEATPVVYPWQIDTIAPDTTIATGPEALSSSAKATFTFSGDDGSGSGVAGFQCRLDSSEAADWKACDSGSAEYEELSQGPHKFEARAIDEAGNADQSPAVSEWSVDTIAPTVQVDSRSQTLLKAGETSEVTWHADENGSFQLRVGGGDCESGTTVDSGPYTTQPASRTSTVGAADLAEGANTLRLCLTDAATNTGQVTTSLTKDTQAPDTTIATGPEALSNSAKATFTFSGDDGSGSGVAGFQCRLDSEDSGDWKACDSGSAEYEELSQGSHKFEARAIDEAGNADQSPAVSEWSVDTIAPDTLITKHPEAFSSSTTAEFQFTGEDLGGSGVAGFQCRLDSSEAADWKACDSGSAEYEELSQGSHRFEVRAIDEAGNADASPAAHTWSVDTVAPSAQITAHPEALVKLATAHFEFTGEDPGGSGVKGFQCRLDSAGWSGCASPQDLSSLPDGSHKFEVRAIDEAGNVGAPDSDEWTVDTTPPAVGIDSGPSGVTNDPTPTFTFHAGEQGAAVQCSIDSGTPDFGPCSDATEDTPESPLADGSWTFRVRSTDEAGNSATATRDFEVDTASPGAPVLSGSEPASPANQNEPKLLGSAPASTTVRIYASADCSGSPAATVSAAELQAGTAVSVPDDTTTHFTATATTAAENTSGCSDPLSYTEDSTAPSTTIDSGPPSLAASATASFAFTGEDPGGSGVAGFQCRLDSSEAADWKACDSGSAEYEELSQGSHRFEVRAIDEAGNADQSPAIAEWTVDTQAPATTIDAHPPLLAASATASFEFSATDGSGSGVAGFQCRRDAEDWTLCTSPRTYSALAEGSHAFEVRATDEAGNVGAPASFEWQIDTKAPATTIDSGPPSLAASATASFAFTGEDPGGSGVAGFQCRLDSSEAADWKACDSGSAEYEELSQGSHRFEVRAIDEAGNADASPAAHTWSVDTVAPSAQITAHPEALVKLATAHFEFTGEDPGGSGVKGFQCRLDSAGWSGCASPQDLSSLPDGSHKFEVRAIDEAGNVGAPDSDEWTVDTTPPAVGIDSGPSGVTNDPTPTFTFHAGEQGAAVQCSIDSGTPDFGPCSDATEDTPESPLADGSWTFRVRSTDEAGNSATATRDFEVDTASPGAPVLSGSEPASPANQNEPKLLGSAPASTTVRIYASADCSGSPAATVSAAELQAGTAVSVPDDTTTHFTATATTAAENTSGCSDPLSYTEDSTAPSTTIDSGPPSLAASATASFAFTGEDPGGSGVAGFQCRLDSSEAADWKACDSGSAEYEELSQGSHRFEVRAIDEAGNADQSPAIAEWTVDTQAPATTIDAHPPLLAASATASFEFSATDGSGSGVAGFQCRRDAEDWTLCTSPRTYSALAEGSHAFEVRATDEAGNVGAPASFEWQIDTKAPATTIDSGPPSLAASATASFAFTGEDLGGSGVAGFQCRLDSSEAADWKACDSGSAEYEELSQGSHRFEVRAIDEAGNADASPAAHTWSVDTVAPSAQITAHPEALVKLATAHFEFTGEDPGGSGVKGFQCRLDSAGWSGCASPQDLSSLPDGSHKFEVRAIDEAGNVGAPDSDEWTVDTTPPAVGIDSGPSGVTNDPTPTFTFHAGEQGAAVQCSIDSGTPDFGPCSDATEDTPESPLADGSWTFRVRSTDEAGNSATATRDFEVDTASPGAPVLSGSEPASPANQNEPKLLGSAPASTTVRIYASADCSGSPAATVSAAELQAGTAVSVPDDTTTHFTATATTAAENTSGCSDPLSYTEDSTAPSTTIDSGPPSLAASATASFAFTGEDPGGSGVAGFQCRLDSSEAADWKACDSGSAEYEELSQGSHRFEVRAIDEAGNADQSPAIAEWTVDTQAPATTIDAHPPLLAASATASFEFSATDGSGSGVAGFQCRRDAEDWTLCTSPRTYSALAEGSHAFEVRATDEAGNVGAPASFEWQIDTKAPATTIDSGPPSLAASATASFAFTGEDLGGSGVAGFQCRLDSSEAADWKACDSGSAEYEELSQGSHRFEVRAIDEAGNADASPAAHTWSVDTVAPSAQITAHPEALVKLATAHFEFTGEDPGGSGVKGFQCRLDSAGWSGCASPQDLSSLPDGSHKFEVRAIDEAGNVGAPDSDEWTVDTTPPAVGIDSGPSGVTNDPTPTFTFHAGEQGAAVQCSIDSGTPDFGPCSDATEDTPESPLADGSWTFRVRSTDEAGNSATATRDFEVDTASPGAPVLSGSEPASPANQNEPKLLGSAPASTTVRIYASADCSGSPAATVSAAELQAGTAVSVPDDTTTHFTATATTAAENTSGCSDPLSYTEDSTAPSTTIDSGPPSLAASATASFAFTGEDPGGSGVAGFQCRLDSSDEGAWSPCNSPQSYIGLVDGAHSFEVRAVDRAGNADASPATYIWSVDTSTPETSTPEPNASGGEASETTNPDSLALRTPVRLLRIAYDVRHGTALLLFEVPGPGTLSASAPTTSLRTNLRNAAARRKAIFWRRSHRIEPKSVHARRAGQVKLRIRLSRAGRWLLREHRRLKVQVRISFRAKGQATVSRMLGIVLKRGALHHVRSPRHHSQ